MWEGEEGAVLYISGEVTYFICYLQTSLKQCSILKEDLAGFVFESNRGTKHSFTAETSLGPEFSAGWIGRKNKRFHSKIEAIKEKVGILQSKYNTCIFITSEYK